MNKLLIEDTDLELDITDITVLAIIPTVVNEEEKKNARNTGLNLCIDFDYEEHEFRQHMINGIINGGNGGWVRCIIVSGDYRIPIDIHGGNMGECYFGYINPRFLYKT